MLSGPHPTWLCLRCATHFRSQPAPAPKTIMTPSIIHANAQHCQHASKHGTAVRLSRQVQSPALHNPAPQTLNASGASSRQITTNVACGVAFTLQASHTTSTIPDPIWQKDNIIPRYNQIPAQPYSPHLASLGHTTAPRASHVVVVHAPATAFSYV